jgi:hypothetical protein
MDGGTSDLATRWRLTVGDRFPFSELPAKLYCAKSWKLAGRYVFGRTREDLNVAAGYLNPDELTEAPNSTLSEETLPESAMALALPPEVVSMLLRSGFPKRAGF